MPTPNSHQIMAVWNDHIFQFSGCDLADTDPQLLKFSMTYEDFTNYDIYAYSTIRSYDCWMGEVHGQIQNLLYFPYISAIYVFDLSSNDFNSEVYSISGPPTNTNENACLAAISCNDLEYLYMVGGLTTINQDAMTKVQRYDIQSSSWDTISSMNTPRVVHACIIDQDFYLWAIGGLSAPDSRLSSIERILITSDGATWHYNNQSLITAVGSTRSVLYEGNIYVIGGASVYGIRNYAQIINTKTGNVSILPDRLNYAAEHVGAALADSTIYIFGGWDGVTTDKWSKYKLPTANPTISPSEQSANPTADPSADPRVAPSIPTANPTLQPSSQPVQQTIAPSRTPLFQ